MESDCREVAQMETYSLCFSDIFTVIIDPICQEIQEGSSEFSC